MKTEVFNIQIIIKITIIYSDVEYKLNHAKWTFNNIKEYLFTTKKWLWNSIGHNLWKW